MPSISTISFHGLPEEAQRELLADLPIREGDTLSDDLLVHARATAKSFDARLEIQVNEAPKHDKVPLKFRDTAAVIIYDPATMPHRIKLDASVLDSMSIDRALPISPNAGTVRLSVVVAKDGSMMEVKPLAGTELLIQPAINAVRQWRYRPVLVNGLPVEVQSTVDVAFVLGR